MYRLIRPGRTSSDRKKHRNAAAPFLRQRPERWWLRRNGTLKVVLLLWLLRGEAGADSINLFPTAVPDAGSAWTGEGTVTGPPGCDPPCACGTSNSALDATATDHTFLCADAFDPLILPPNQRIDSVRVNVLAKYADGSNQQIRVRVRAPALYGTTNLKIIDSPDFPSGGTCEYRLADPANDITHLDNGISLVDHPEVVNALQVCVRRSDSTSDANLRVEGIRIRVETVCVDISDCDGDGIGDLCDPEVACSNCCDLAFDGECEDGGPGSVSDECARGTDCADCGCRNIPQPPDDPCFCNKRYGDGCCDCDCLQPDPDCAAGECCAPGCGGCYPDNRGDGCCDEVCNNPQCNFDDGDCAQPPCAPGCSECDIGDCVCNDACNNTACRYDGGDCDQCAPGCFLCDVRDCFCDAACNNAACDFDGGDCQPDCAPGCTCDILGDCGCDAECNRSACNFDHGDCLPDCAPSCLSCYLGDGYCDRECFNSACGFDHGDCYSEVQRFVRCMKGPAVPLTNGTCLKENDADLDGDVDLKDFQSFQLSFP
jgi:hypothetical protein